MAENINDVISKPKDSSGDNTKTLIAVIKDVMNVQTEKGYKPSFALGVSFGVDLSKWREVLGEIFNSHAESIKDDGFNEIKKFERALLITDPVSIKDKNGKGILQADSLNVWLSGGSSSYLHTKMILIRFQKAVESAEHIKNEYVLIISSKNITYSKSYDLVIPLYSQGDTENKGHGKELLNYILFLGKAKSDEEKQNLISNLSGLENIKFDVKNQKGELEAHVTDLYFSYTGHRFEKTLWDEVLKTDLVISPYLCEEEFYNWCEKNTEITLKKKKILTYWNSADKVKDSVKERPNIYVGKSSIEGGRIKFHAKLYARVINYDKEKRTKIWIGSANLTKEAKEVHFELLLGIEFKDNGGVHAYIDKQILHPSSSGNFNNPLIEKFEEKKIGEVLDGDEEGENPDGVSRTYRYALYNTEFGYEWRIYNSSSELKSRNEVSQEKISNWIEVEDGMSYFVCEDNYLSADGIKEDGYLAYEEYKKLVARNIKKMRGKYYRSIFYEGNPNKKTFDKQRRGKEKGYKQYIKYPCLYKKMMDIYEQNKDVDIEKELSKLYYGFMDSEDIDNEMVSLMKAYVEALGEE